MQYRKFFIRYNFKFYFTISSSINYNKLAGFQYNANDVQYNELGQSRSNPTLNSNHSN
jgi:hypothetical protein